MEQPDRIFMIDNGSADDGRYQRLLEEHGYEVFATNNAYKLIRYAAELQPRLYVMDNDARDVDAWQVLAYLSANHYLESAPAVMLNAEPLSSRVSKGAAHYFPRRDNGRFLLEIADAYCRGRQHYQVLLLEDYLPSSADYAGETAGGYKISCFKVYDVHGAQMFLRRNTPQALVIHCRREDYDGLRRQIDFGNTFYVENRGNMEKLVSFLT